VLRSYELHANCYVTKPGGPGEIHRRGQSIDRFWLTVVTLPNGNEPPAAHRPADRGQRGRCAPDPRDAGGATPVRRSRCTRPSGCRTGWNSSPRKPPGWCCSTCRCPTATGSILSPRCTRIRPDPDHRAHRQRRPDGGAVGGEDRRPGLPRQGQARPRAADALDALLASNASNTSKQIEYQAKLRRAHRFAEPQPAARPPEAGGLRPAQPARGWRWCSSTSTTSSSSTTALATAPATSC